MVADTVQVEPVSTAKFPANREKNREFRRIRPLGAILKADTRADSKAFSQIPYTTEQGIVSAEQGIFAREQGILSAKIEIIAGCDFETKRLWVMSAVTPKADIDRRHGNVRFVPTADICQPYSITSSA